MGDRKGGRGRRGESATEARQSGGEAVESGTTPAAVVTGSPRETILRGILAVDPAAAEGDIISLTRLRLEVGGALGKEEFDRAVVDLVQRGVLAPFQHAHPGILTPAERAAMVEAGLRNDLSEFERSFMKDQRALWNGVSVRDPSALPRRKGR